MQELLLDERYRICKSCCWMRGIEFARVFVESMVDNLIHRELKLNVYIHLCVILDSKLLSGLNVI